MGILNATPDSLWSGVGAPDAAEARRHMEAMAAEGARICDVGAESTRPGAAPVEPAEQLRRLAGVCQALAAAPPPLVVSIDTTSATVASRVLAAGAVLVNDVSAGQADPAMLGTVADHGAAVCLVHMRGTPRTMQRDPHYSDVVAEVYEHLAARVAAAVAAGVEPSRILVDPGVGFGKTLEHNLSLLASVGRLTALGCPVLVGVSRKSLFDRLLGRSVDERLAASLSAGLAAVARGAAVLRVHDVRETVDALAVWDAVGRAGTDG